MSPYERQSDIERKGQKHLLAMSEVAAGRMTRQQAADKVVGIKLLSLRRLLVIFRLTVAATHAYQLRGRQPDNKLDDYAGDGNSRRR